MTAIYNTGTVSVTNGSAVVTGSGTAWSVSLVAGGTFFLGGISVPILSVQGDTSLTLAMPWPGTTAAGAAYAIERENSDAANIVDLYDKLTRVLVQLSLAGITPNASGSIADRDALTLGTNDKGFLFLHAQIGVAFAFYRWTGTAWDGPFPVAPSNGVGGLSDIVAGTNVTVDKTNPAIPVISATGVPMEQAIHGATAKASPVAADEFGYADSESMPPWALKKLTWANFKAAVLAGLGAASVAFTQVGTGGAVRTVQAKLQESVTPEDFGAVGDLIEYTGNATIASGSAILTVSGASFALADVGKAITVPGAGAAGAILVTTIAGFTSATQVSLGSNAATALSSVSTKVSYGTNDSAAIQNAINTGKIIRFKPQGGYAVATALTVGNGNSTTLSAKNGIVLEGTTSGATAAEMSPAVLPTRLKWLGASGGTMLTVNGPMVGCNIKGIVFDCGSLANTAIRTNHMIASSWHDVLATNYKGFAFIHEAYAAFSGLAQGANKNTFINCRAMNPASGGSGMRVGVTSGFVVTMLDVAQNVWINCEWYRDGTSATSTSLYLAFCDNLTFIESQFSAQGGSSGVCIYILPPSGGAGNTAFPDEILFLNCPVMTGFTADLSWAPNNGILCDPYPTNDSEPIPTSPFIRGRTFKQQFFNGGTFTAKFGYDTGAGGTVTQATSKTTGVTLNKLSGQITMNAAALAAGAIASFTLTDTAIVATDVLILNHVSGGTAGAYSLNAQCASGSATISIRNNTSGSLSEAVVIGFVLVKGVTA